MEDDRFIMRSYRTSEGRTIWTEGSIHESKQFFFFETKDGGAFPLQMYDTYDEADKICKELQLHPHPNFGGVLLRPFQVEEDGIVKAFLALQPQGESLSDLTDRRRSSNKFYDIRISPFYQKILIDLIVVVRYSMSTNLQCDLSLSDVFNSDLIVVVRYSMSTDLQCDLSLLDVFILEDSDESCPPHITIMKFKFRDGHASNTDWSHLETFIQKINSRVNFPTRKEMGALLSSLKDLNEKNFATIASLSLFWSSSERVVFCGNWGDFSDTQLVPIHSNLAKPFGNNPSEWDKMVCRDPSLAIMKMQADKKMQVDKKEILTPGLAVDAMRCFKFIRKCLLHFDQMRTNGVVYNTPLEVLRAFERVFGDFIHELSIHARHFENTRNVTICPRKAELSKLYLKSA